MNTTGMVMTVTDELLAELAQELNRCKFSDDDDSDESWPSISGEAVSALISELRRLRAENAELAQSLAESRANDQAAMGWLTSLRWASGDRGERMLPELVTHIESLAKDAGRYRWLSKKLVGASFDWDGEGMTALAFEMPDSITVSANCDAVIDTAMAAQ